MTAPTNVVAETEATAKVEEVAKEAEKAPEATVLDRTGLDDVDSVLASFFGSPSEDAKVSESKHEESTEEVSTNSVEETCSTKMSRRPRPSSISRLSNEKLFNNLPRLREPSRKRGVCSQWCGFLFGVHNHENAI